MDGFSFVHAKTEVKMEMVFDLYLQRNATMHWAFVSSFRNARLRY